MGSGMLERSKRETEIKGVGTRAAEIKRGLGECPKTEQMLKDERHEKEHRSIEEQRSESEQHY